MAPKKKFTIDDITEAAFQIVRKNGFETLSARAIAAELKASTMPIYSRLNSMEELEEIIIKKAWAILLEYQEKARSGNVYLDMGLGYVMFAKEEKHLFRCFNCDKHLALNRKCGKSNFNILARRLAAYYTEEAISDEMKRKLLFQGWIFCHGLANLVNTSFSKQIQKLDNEKDLMNFFTEANETIWEGLKSFIETISDEVRADTKP